MYKKYRNDKRIPNLVYCDYYLVQGDCFGLSVTPEYGDIYPFIQGVKFKLYLDENRHIVFEQDYIYNEEDGVFYLDVMSEHTAKWDLDTDYWYEIELSFNDGRCNETPRFGKFILLQQGV